MNVQQDLFQAICDALSFQLTTNFPQLIHVSYGWPDNEFLSTSSNLPAAFFVNLAQNYENNTNRMEIHKNIKYPDGTGLILTEQMRADYTLQLSLFTQSQAQQQSLGSAIAQFLVTYNYIPLLESSTAVPEITPFMSGENVRLIIQGDQSNLGKEGSYRRDLTFSVTARILDATQAYRVNQITSDVII